MSISITIPNDSAAWEFAETLVHRSQVVASLIRAIDAADNDADSKGGTHAGDRTNLICIARDYAAETERLAEKGWAEGGEA